MHKKISMPREFNVVVTKYLQRSGLRVEYGHRPYLAKGKIAIGDVEKAWHAGAIDFVEEGGLFLAVCGQKIPFAVDMKRIRNNLDAYLRHKANPSDIVCVASILGVHL